MEADGKAYSDSILAAIDLFQSAVHDYTVKTLLSGEASVWHIPNGNFYVQLLYLSR